MSRQQEMTTFRTNAESAAQALGNDGLFLPDDYQEILDKYPHYTNCSRPITVVRFYADDSALCFGPGGWWVEGE